MKNKLLTSIKNLLYSFVLTYKAANSLFVSKAIISIFLIVLPFLQLECWRNITNLLVNKQANSSNNFYDRIEIWVIIYILIVIFIMSIGQLEEFINNKYNDRISLFVDSLLVDKLSGIDYSFFDSNELHDKIEDSWSLVHAITSLSWQLSILVQSFVKVLIGFFLLSRLNIYVSIVLVIASVPAIIYGKKSNEFKWGNDRASSKSIRRMNYYKEALIGKGIFEVRINGLLGFFTEKYTAEWKTWYSNRKKSAFKINVLSLLSLLVLTITEGIAILMALLQVYNSKIGIGDFTYYIALIPSLKGNIENFVYTFSNFEILLREMESVRELLELKSDIEDTGKLDIDNIHSIEFKNISFHYPDRDEVVLKNCSFMIGNHEKVGLVGANGSGKSTIVKLCMRLYNPTEGDILINGIDIKLINVNKLRKLFGVLFQDYCKYSLTFRENIVLSNLDYFYDDKMIWNACESSKLYELVASWKCGLDTALTRKFDRDGKELSGGQWQRVSLGRAFFDNKSFYILDEPSSSLDPLAEDEIVKSLARISHNKSSIMIAHRLSSLYIVDRIYVLKDGYIIENGSHHDLIAQNGEYSKMFALQSNKYM